MTQETQNQAVLDRITGHPPRSDRARPRAERLAWACSAALATAVLVGGCAGPNLTPTPSADRPGIEIDSSFQRDNGSWTFTGRVDPQGAATDVVLEIGPGPSNARVFTRQIPVVRAPADPMPLTITTRDIPDIPEICVRFTATNSAGSSSSTPLCFPYALPSPPAEVVTPTIKFSAPAFGTTTVLDRANFTVAWTESNSGVELGSHSLQRRVAAYVDGACGAFGDDGASSAAPSPVDVTDLVNGSCYEWVLSLSVAGSTSMTTSGVVRIDLGGSGQ